MAGDPSTDLAPEFDPHADILSSAMQRPQVALDIHKDTESESQQKYQNSCIPLTRLALNTQRWRADRNTLDLVFLGTTKVAVVIGPRAQVTFCMALPLDVVWLADSPSSCHLLLLNCIRDIGGLMIAPGCMHVGL